MNTTMLAAASLSSMFDHEFIRDAFTATGLVAPACGLVGYFLVLRNQVFASDAMSHAAFTGSLAALAFGLDQRFGLFGAAIAFGVGVGMFARRQQFRDVVIGNLFSWLLGLGVLFLAIFTSNQSAVGGSAGPSVLFGSVYGIGADRAHQAAVVSALVVVVMVIIARPLLFSSLDQGVATARGVPVQRVSMVFLVVTAVMVAEAVQVVGALLVLGLLATPALTVQRVIARPFVAFWASAGLCLAETWTGLTVSYLWPHLPPSFVIIAVSCGVFAMVIVGDGWRRKPGR